MLVKLDNFNKNFDSGIVKGDKLFVGVQVYKLPDNVKDELPENIAFPAIYKGDNAIEIIEFIELRGKSDYSIKDSVAKVKDIVSKAEIGAGLNDHGVAFGLYDFNQAMIKQNKKAINGSEIYIEEDVDSYFHWQRTKMDIKFYQGF